MRPIGFSTGAMAKGDFRRALEMLQGQQADVVELSALRFDELDPLLAALPTLDLEQFSFVSIHAPTRFPLEIEASVIERLHSVAERGYPIVVHRNVIFTSCMCAELSDK